MAKPVTARKPNAVPEGFDPVPHLRYRMYLPALIGRSELAVYDALRSLVWRSERGPDKLVELMNKGLLVAKADQATLAEITGLTRPRVCEFIQRLVQLGWVLPVPCEDAAKSRIYALGVRRQTSRTWVEVDYAEEVMRGWYMKADKLAQEQHGQPYRKLPVKAQKGLVRQVVPDSIQALKKELKETPERLSDFNKISHLHSQNSAEFSLPLFSERTTPLFSEVTTSEAEKTAQPLGKLGGFSELNDGPIHNYLHKQLLNGVQEGYCVTLPSPHSLDASDSPEPRPGPAVQAASSLRSLAARPEAPARDSVLPSALFPRLRAAPTPVNDRQPHTPPVPPAPLAPRRPALADTFGHPVTPPRLPTVQAAKHASAPDALQNDAEAHPATFPLPRPKNRS